MKKLLAGLTILISISSIGQQISNGDFENWVQQTYGEEPANWGELNTQLFSSIIPGLIDSTILKSQDSYSGNFAMELRSKTYSIFGALFYTTLINDISSPPPTIFLPVMPYLFYLLISKTQLRIKIITCSVVLCKYVIVHWYLPFCVCCGNVTD